jgi:arylsulfatase A-like enzyme
LKRERPNILIFMSDNQPAELLGCYGNDEVHTPHLDELAAGGMRFNNAFCVNAMCSPCRASVLTGLMPSQHGIHTWLDDGVMEAWPDKWNAIGEFRSFPTVLKEQGYLTALIGKYHLGVPFEPQNGFDHWITFPHGHTLDFHNISMIDGDERYVFEGHSVDYFTQKSVEFLDAYDDKAGAPFFLFVPYNGPYGHWPAVKGPADNRFAHLYDETEMYSVPREGLSKETIDRFMRRTHEYTREADYAYHLRIPNDLETLRNYFSQMSMVDDGVGRVVDALRRNDLSENTLVVYTADHGYSLGHNGFWGHGQSTWPSNMHHAAFNIPLIVARRDHIEAAQVRGDLTSQLDLFATLLDYIGLDTAKLIGKSDSRSFAPLLNGNPCTWRDAVFMEQEETRAIRTAQWLHMMRFRGSAEHPLEDEMYDLVKDPKEKNNLAKDPSHADIASGLSQRITAFFDAHSDPRYDLWKGGTAKSNSDAPWLWKAAWGEDWEPNFGGGAI